MAKDKTPRGPEMPRYQFNGKAHLPADKGWRDFGRQKDVLIMETSADGLFQTVMREMIRTLTENLSEGDANTLGFGLMLNTIEQMPVEMRAAFVAAVEQGLVMTFMVGPEGEVIADLSKEVEALDTPAAAPAGPHVRDSGLLVP